MISVLMASALTAAIVMDVCTMAKGVTGARYVANPMILRRCDHDLYRTLGVSGGGELGYRLDSGGAAGQCLGAPMIDRDELRAAYRRLQNYIQRPTPMSPERDRQALADLQLLGDALK